MRLDLEQEFTFFVCFMSYSQWVEELWKVLDCAADELSHRQLSQDLPWLLPSISAPILTELANHLNNNPILHDLPPRRQISIVGQLSVLEILLFNILAPKVLNARLLGIMRQSLQRNTNHRVEDKHDLNICSQRAFIIPAAASTRTTVLIYEVIEELGDEGCLILDFAA